MSINAGRPSLKQNGCFGGNNSRRGSKPRDMADHDLVNFITSLFRKPEARKAQQGNKGQQSKARQGGNAHEGGNSHQDKPATGESA